MGLYQKITDIPCVIVLNVEKFKVQRLQGMECKK